jgi:hypothetical protein
MILSFSIPSQAVELGAMADCSIKVFREINRSHVWSGKPPVGCSADIYVEKRPNGIFVTTWNSDNSDRGWVRISLSSAMGFFEVADRKELKRASQDIKLRTKRIERCLESIIRENDPLECRDRAAKFYLAGEKMGVEYERSIWLDDNGRHSVVEYAYGDSREVVRPPADLFRGPALPPGTELNIHLFNTR